MEMLIRDGHDLALCIQRLEFRSRPFAVKVYEPKSIRSDDQNRLMWMWAEEVAKQRQDSTAAEVQAEWKLRFGIPIVIASDEKMWAVWTEVAAKLIYEKQLELMYYMDVTSIMNTKQMSEFLDQVQRHCLEQKWKLTEPMRGS